MAGGGKALRLLEKASAVLAAAASPVFSALTRPAADPGQFGAALALVVGMLAFCAGLVLALKKACGTVCVCEKTKRRRSTSYPQVQVLGVVRWLVGWFACVFA
jgi:hypothetical protein